MPDERRFVMPGVLAKVPDACDFVVVAAEAAGLDERSVYHCQMATDEWCTNIIEHGFAGHNEQGRIEIVCKVQPTQFVVSISDNSPPFDPTRLPEPDPNTPLEDRQPGGLGWFFIRKVMDEVRYEFRNGYNRLIMIKRGSGLNLLPGEATSPYPARTLPSGVRVITASGRIDSVAGRQLETALQMQVDAGHYRLVVDLHDANYISSTGLKALLTALRRVQEFRGNVVLAAIGPRVREVLEMSGFDTVFVIAPTAEEAARLL